MKCVKTILILLGFFVTLILFTGFVSAASLNITEVELGADGVKNYTESNNAIPSYVEVGDKNSSAPSFLKTLTKTTVQLNSNSTASVNISSVNNPTGPSGSATGTLYKSDYVTVANNVYNYINTNGRAPNYASSTLGNIRYEALVYAYARIVNFYRVNNRLPDSVTITNIVGVGSVGVVIDTIAPTVSNNLASGTYNTTKNVTLTATDHVDANPKVYYSLNNGTTWINQIKTVTLALNQGVTVLKYYGRDAAGNQGSTQTRTYTIDTVAPTVTESDPSNGEVDVSEDIIITITFNKPVQAGNLLIGLNSTNGTDIPVITNITDNILTITPSTFLSADMYTLTLYTGSIIDLVGNPLEVWVISFNTTGLFTADSIAAASNAVKSYIETNHNLPSSVIISGTQVDMRQFLRLVTEAVLNINNNSTVFIPIGSYNSAPNPSENIASQDINKTEYLDIADRVKTYMDSNERAPNYATINSTGSTIRYESLIYMYARVLNSYNVTGNLPDYITVSPWGSLPGSNVIGNTSSTSVQYGVPRTVYSPNMSYSISSGGGYYNSYVPGRGYVGRYGYVQSTVSLYQLQYQQTLKEYNTKKTNTWNKIKGTLTQNQDDYYIKEGQKNLEKWQEIRSSVLKPQMGGDPDDEDISKFFTEFYKWSKGKIKEGVNEIKAGNYVKGMKDITIGTLGFDIWGTSLTSYLIDEALPK